jgi:hypothetical protein
MGIGLGTARLVTKGDGILGNKGGLGKLRDFVTPFLAASGGKV